ncbi:hypothetical protein SESBI_11903 [Sesbania bispinosa]|nr:hypothetical protein SESBI_11903 [Sesbania bispinosa]
MCCPGNDQTVASSSDNVTEIDVNFTVAKEDPDCFIVAEIQTDGNLTKHLSGQRKWTLACKGSCRPSEERA